MVNKTWILTGEGLVRCRDFRAGPAATGHLPPAPLPVLPAKASASNHDTNPACCALILGMKMDFVVRAASNCINFLIFCLYRRVALVCQISSSVTHKIVKPLTKRWMVTRALLLLIAVTRAAHVHRHNYLYLYFIQDALLSIAFLVSEVYQICVAVPTAVDFSHVMFCFAYLLVFYLLDFRGTCS